jgi:hypothetical protein
MVLSGLSDLYWISQLESLENILVILMGPGQGLFTIAVILKTSDMVHVNLFAYRLLLALGCLSTL